MMRSAVKLLIYNSVYNYTDSEALAETGDITSSYNSDGNCLLEVAQFLHGAYVSIISLLVAIVCLILFAGVGPALAAVGLMLLTLPIQSYLMNKLFALRPQIQEMGGKRSRILSEIFRGIRIIKMLEWCLQMAERVGNARDDELVIYKQMHMLRVPMMLLSMMLPAVLTFMVFSTASLLNPSTLDPANAFPALTILQSMRLMLIMRSVMPN